MTHIIRYKIINCTSTNPFSLPLSLPFPPLYMNESCAGSGFGCVIKKPFQGPFFSSLPIFTPHSFLCSDGWVGTPLFYWKGGDGKYSTVVYRIWIWLFSFSFFFDWGGKIPICSIFSWNSFFSTQTIGISVNRLKTSTPESWKEEGEKGEGDQIDFLTDLKTNGWESVLEFRLALEWA